MKSSEAIILAVMNTILSNCVEKPEKYQILSFIDSFITGNFEPTNDQLPASVVS